ncbi:MAG: MBL fold metallo-hydrolase [Eubacteriales bacterium]
MSLTVHSLFSGSSANSTLIRSGRTAILIDAGGSMKRIRLALESLGCPVSGLSAIFVTHEHSDHISAIPMLTKHFSIPVHVTVGSSYALSKADPACLITHPPRYEVTVGDLTVRSFLTSHDSHMSVGYTVESCGVRFGLATDTGVVTPEIVDALTGCRGALIEANHDVIMLRDGPYPAELKERIRSPYGHLSNQQAAILAARLVRTGTGHLLLGHLSAENNTPERALTAVRSYLADNGLSASVAVAARSEVTELSLSDTDREAMIC